MQGKWVLEKITFFMARTEKMTMFSEADVDISKRNMMNAKSCCHRIGRTKANE